MHATVIFALFAAAAVASPVSPAADVAPAALEQRDGSAVVFDFWDSGACTGDKINTFERSITPGICEPAVFGQKPTFGAKFKSSNAAQVCVVKFFEAPNCGGGKSTTWSVPQSVDTTKCVPIANNGGGFRLQQGVKSFIINCAVDHP